MATNSRNANEISKGNIDRNKGADKKVQHGTPDFKISENQEQPQSDSESSSSPSSVNNATTAAPADNANQDAVVAAVDNSTEKRKANDQKIVEETQEKQRLRNASQAKPVATNNKYTVYITDYNGVSSAYGVFNTPEEAEKAADKMESSYEYGDERGVNDYSIGNIDDVNTVNDVDLNSLHAWTDIYRSDRGTASTPSKRSPRTNSKRGTQNLGAGEVTPGSAVKNAVDNATAQAQAAQAQASQAQTQAQTQASPQAQSQSQPQQQDEEFTRADIDDFLKELFYSRRRAARKENKRLREKYKSERRGAEKRGEDMLQWEQNFWNENSLDEEAFESQLPPIYKKYRTNAEYEQERQMRKQLEKLEEQASKYESTPSDLAEEMSKLKDKLDQADKTHKKDGDTHKQDNLIDQTVWDMMIGFFHIEGEKLETNEKTGEKSLKWNRRVEDAMNMLMEDFDGTGLDGMRTVFRMVRLYATMAVDRQGKMFNEGRDEWSLTPDEFIDICNCMHKSILIFGHPFVAPVFLSSTKADRVQLRGTDMYPSGVIPRAVAEAITGEDSNIRFPKVDLRTGLPHPKAGQPMTADDLIDACREEWIYRTQPLMNANLVNKPNYGKKKTKKDKDGNEVEIKERNLVAQRIAIEDALQAFARLDGTDAKAFGSKFNIDTARHYKLSEYRDQLNTYATVVGDQYDADAVVRLEEEKIKKYENENKKRRGRRKIGKFEAACNIMTSGIKTNALWWNVPIRVSAIAEKGVGNLQTWMTLQALRGRYANPERYTIDQSILDAFRTEEGYQAIDAAYLLLEIGGPGALSGFARTGAPMNQDEAIKYLRGTYLRETGSEQAAWIQEQNIKLNKLSQKILAGDTAFRKSDITNFFNALMISNQAIADTQEKLISQHGGELDQYAGMSLTGREMSDIFKANNGDVSRFLTEIMTTSAGKDALMMMKANNIAQFNAVSYKVSSMLRDHGIGNAAVTAFVDSFATYGVNFLYAMAPGARTFTYIAQKFNEQGGDITASDLVMGGGLGVRDSDIKIKDDIGFYNGLKMNIMFDVMSMAKWGLGAILIGGTLLALGFEPPDDPRQVLNISTWKIGANIGIGPDTDGDGKGNGVEIQTAYWLNDLTQWGLPIGYVAAVAFSLPNDAEIDGKSKIEIMEGVLIDSVTNQFDGNVVLDCFDCILNWGDDLIDINQTIDDPTHEMSFSPFFGISELMLRFFGKVVPGAPLYRAWGTSAALRGPNARAFTTNKVYDKSSKWAEQVGKTDYIDDPVERLIRKYSAGNWLLAAFGDISNLLSGEADKKTGYAWWEMPARTKTEPFALALIEEQKMDYDHLEEGETKESYNAKRTEDLKKMIKERGYNSPEEAIRDGFFITHDLRYAALDTCFSELNALKNEYDTKCDKQFETYEEWNTYKKAYDKKKSRIWKFINNWLQNEDIPTWTENYEQLLSDWEVTYVREDGSPATSADFIVDRIFNQGQGVAEKWSLKGNHPTSMLPLTTVDYSSNDLVSRGWSGETNPYWENEDSNLTNYANLKALGNEVIKVGRDAGSTVNDVYFGEEYDGERLHPDDATIGERAWVPVTTTLPDDIRDFNAETATGGIYGNLGKSNGDDSDNSSSDNSTDDDKKPWKSYGDKKPWKTSSTKYTSSFYPKKSYGYGTSSNQGNYNPKIYSNSRSVNADRASTMYSKTPQSSARSTYLRPSVSTKGSREAYKRQDM